MSLKKFIDPITNVTCLASINSYKFIGKGDKNAADQAAVDSMRKELNNIPFDGEVVIGEGEMDEAPMLYIGEKLGLGGDISVDIAVDPLDGTKLAAENKPNAVSVIAISNSNCFLRAPDMYMEKISVGPELPNNIINLDDPLTKNIERLAKAKKKDIINIKVCLLDRPRHKKQIDILKNMNCKLKLISDGDVVGAMQASLHDSDVDMYLGTGGAPEGVLAAAAIKCLGGQFQGRLVFNTKDEELKASKMGIQKFEKIYSINDLVKDDVIFSCTGVTNGDLVEGIKKVNNRFTTETFSMHFQSKTIKKIKKEYVI